jgi:hypothetical protein
MVLVDILSRYFRRVNLSEIGVEVGGVAGKRGGRKVVVFGLGRVA